MINTRAFKAYDIRGVCPDEVNEELAYRVGKVFCALFGAESVVVGRDVRLTGPGLLQALCDGLQDGGANVIDIGQCGTEMIYFATACLHADGGIMAPTFGWGWGAANAGTAAASSAAAGTSQWACPRRRRPASAR